MAQFNGKQFQTAAHRRLGKPLAIEIADWVFDADHPDGQEKVYEIRLDPRLDVVRFGALFGAFANALKDLGKDDVSQEQKINQLDTQLPQAKAAFRQCCVPTDRSDWDEAAAAVDTQMLGQLVRYINQELAGTDPTVQASSSDGSTPTGPTSTDGVSPEGSTPEPSRLPAPSTGT